MQCPTEVKGALGECMGGVMWFAILDQGLRVTAKVYWWALDKEGKAVTLDACYTSNPCEKQQPMPGTQSNKVARTHTPQGF